MSRHPVVSRSVVVALLVAAVSVAFVLPVQDHAEGQHSEVTPEQAVVARMIGTWDIQVYGMGPEPAPGTSVIRPLGRQWAVEEVKSTFMGQPFEGVSIAGFDTELGKFVGVWADSMGTKLEMNRGTWDEATQTIVDEPKEQDGPMGKVTVVSRFHSVDADHWVYTQSPVDDESTELFKVTYARKQ
jgi:hypothetical protein